MSGHIALRSGGSRLAWDVGDRREWARWSNSALSVANRQPGRTTRRRSVRLVFTLIASAVVAAVGLWAAGVAFAPASAAGDSGEHAVGLFVQVERGESLWVIASRTLPRLDPWAGVEALKRANGLSSDRLQVGQLLRIPVE